MAKDLNKALESVELTYAQIKDIADSMLSGPFEEPNRIVNFIQCNIESMSIDMLKDDYKKKYHIINVPATKLRTFMEADLKYLVDELNKN